MTDIIVGLVIVMILATSTGKYVSEKRKMCWLSYERIKSEGGSN